MKYSLQIFFILLCFIGSCSTAEKGKGNQQEQEKAQSAAVTATQPPLLYLPDDLEASLWAESPQFFNPTNIDIDTKGRIWVTEAVNYRNFNNAKGHKAHTEGDRVMILTDTNKDGVADSSKVFVQDKDLRSPLGIAVVGNKIIVSCSPSVIVYTDANGDDKPDSKEVFLTGFGGLDHDHGLHAGVAGPDGKLYFIAGNAGPHLVTDKSGRTLRSGSIYTGGTPYNEKNTPGLKSDDGKIYVGGLTFRVNPDGTGLEVLAHNFRNSYEVFVDSFGNLWQNDNDDQVASCRTSWLIEGANAGFFSSTGERTWQADRRPGQSIATAHWHQEDPSIMPAGDIYGAGSPTGVVLNEGDALGQHYRGLLLSADAGRNIIFGYYPKLVGAGFPLEGRMNFIASVDSDNKNYKWNAIEEDTRKWFRPSDVAIGTDGAIYVADWYDPVVGGHQMNDKKGYGRIYRIASKNKRLTAPTINLKSTAGQLQALLSPAINVRNQGSELLKAKGASVLPQVKEVLSSDNPYHRARAVWLLSQLGAPGLKEVEILLTDADPQIRITAFRALKQAKPKDISGYAGQMVQDKSAAVRREVALAMRDIPLVKSQSILLSLAEQYDGQDPWYLNALGIALQDKAEAFYPDLLKFFKAKEPENWPQPLANLVWELHPAAAVPALVKRATSAKLIDYEQRKALVALAFINNPKAARAMQQLASSTISAVADQAQYWLQFRKTNEWQTYLKNWQPPAGTLPVAQPQIVALVAKVINGNVEMTQRVAAATEMLKSQAGKLHLVNLAANRTLPEAVSSQIKNQMLQTEDRFLKPLIALYFKSSDSSAFPIKAIIDLPANKIKGKTLLYSNCIRCHKVGDTGGEIGPYLTNIQNKYDKPSLLDSINHPDAGVAFGSEPYLISLKNGAILYGLLLSDGPVVTVLDINGGRFMLDASQVASKKQINTSPMPSPQQLELSHQDVADITAFLLEENKI